MRPAHPTQRNALCGNMFGLARGTVTANRRDWRGSVRTRRKDLRPTGPAFLGDSGHHRATATALPADRCARGPTPAGSSTGRTDDGVRRHRSRPAAACAYAPAPDRPLAVPAESQAPLRQLRHGGRDAVVDYLV